MSISTYAKRELAQQWNDDGVSLSEIGRRLGCSRQYVAKLLVAAAVHDDDDDADAGDNDNVSERVLRARAAVLELQAIKLRRQLALDAAKLIRADYIDQVLLAFLRHFEAQTNWIRSNRLGDSELLEAHLASVKGAQREIHRRHLIEGAGIDDDMEVTDD